MSAAPMSLFPARRRRGWSRTVGLLKVLLPTVALSLVALVIIWAQVHNNDAGFRVGFSLVSPEDAHKLTMMNARYAGTSRDNQPYLVTARQAEQEAPGADLIRLSEPKGDITMKSGAWVALTAPAGDYHQESEILDLSGGVNLFHDSGMEFNSPTARINLRDSTAIGHDPVEGHGPAAEIRSQGFHVLDEGGRVIFTGKAHLTLYPRKTDGPAEGATRGGAR